VTHLVRRVFPALIVLSALLFLPKLFAGDTWLYQELLGQRVLDFSGSLLKLFGLGCGAWFALRAARALGRENTARGPWLLFGAWLSMFLLGQLVLSTYLCVLRRSAPFPSFGDLFFLCGYPPAIVGGCWFVRAYVTSGMPVGTPRELGALAAIAAVVFTALGLPLLAPIAASEAPLSERLLNVAYPVLDLLTLVPTLLLARIAVRLRGGRIGFVWGLIVAGLAAMCAGDVLFAYFSSAGKKGLEPLVDAMFAIGYLASGWGTAAQYRLATE
jgi:hypothetical protein